MKKILTLTISLLSLTFCFAQAPGNVGSGLTVWLKADAGTSSTTDAAYLNFWNDQSTAANHATQSTASAKPQYYSNMINGNPAIKTTGPRYFNVDFSDFDNQNYTIFTVTKRQSGSNFQHILGVQQPGAYIGLNLGYSGPNLVRFFQYGNLVNIAVPTYTANEIPAILSAQFDHAVGKRVSQIRDGVEIARAGRNKTHYPMTGQGNVGRGNDSYGFNGLIAEVIIYNRILTAAEKKQVHSYLSVKYGLNLQTAENLFYNDATYSNDVFGIGKDLALQGLNQTASNSVNPDDILELRSPSSLDDGDYLMCGNDNGATSFAAYSGSNCAISAMLGRKWKAKRTGDVGTVTLRFDMSGMIGFTGSKLGVLIDSDGDGYDDETILTGTYSAPYFDVTGVNLANNATMALVNADATWYAVTSGNTSGAIWATSLSGTPQILASFCAGSNLIVNTGVTVNNDWASFSCNDFNILIGGIWNASAGTMNVAGQYTIAGTFNAQTSTVSFNGTNAQTISGSGFANIYNMNANNVSGVNISLTSGGVRVRNILNVNSGVLTTNTKLTLISDATTTGMIGPLTAGSVSGEVIVQRYHNAAAQGWVNLSCPAQLKTLQDWNDDLITTGFVGSDFPPPYTFNNIHKYSESLSGGMNVGYSGATNITNTIERAVGYFVFMNAGVMNLDVTGQIYSGSQSMPVTYTNTGNASGDGWNLLGNPYPCAIDWNSTSWTKSKIANALYVWNAAIGQYASYVGGIGTNGGSRYIPSSQSFFVITNGVNPILTLDENCKTTNQGVFKSTEIVSEAFTLRIDNNQYSDETTLARNATGTLYFDSALDAYKLRSPLTEVPYMASMSEEGDDLSINSIKDNSEETIIALRIESGNTGTYILSHKGLSSFAKGACVTLEDLLTGEIYPLNQYDEIPLELEAGNTSLRFQLRIGGTSVANISGSGCPGMENGSATIEIGDGGPSNVTWMNNEGETILTTIGVTTSDEIVNLTTGTYFVQISNNGACGTTESEFFIGQDAPIVSNSIIFPASCESTSDGGVALNIMGGSIPYAVKWSNGSEEQSIDNLEMGDYVAFVKDSKGCSATFNINIPVNSVLTSNFETVEETYEMMNGAVMVDFFNTSENAEEFTWIFNDGTQLSTETNPSHLFNAKGSFEVTLVSSDDNCEAIMTRSIRIVQPQTDGTEFSADMIGTLTDNGVQIMFFFDQPRQLQINAYNVLGQQLIQPIKGVYERQTITFSDRRYAANALIEVVDLNTGERALLRMGN